MVRRKRKAEDDVGGDRKRQRVRAAPERSGVSSSSSDAGSDSDASVQWEVLEGDAVDDGTGSEAVAGVDGEYSSSDSEPRQTGASAGDEQAWERKQAEARRARKERRERALEEAREDEKALSRALFQDQDELLAQLQGGEGDDDDFFANVFGDGGEDETAERDNEDGDGEDDEVAWEDEDDGEVSVDISSKARLRKLRKKEEESLVSGDALVSRLRHQFETLHHSAHKEWASVSEESVKRHALLQSSNPLVRTTKTELTSGRLDVTRIPDGNIAERSNCVIQSLDFHPNGQVLFTAGLDKTLRLFQIDGSSNPKLQSVFFPDMPILSASICADGNEIFCSGRRSFFYSYDVESGAISKVSRIIGRYDRSLERSMVSPDNKHFVVLGKDGTSIFVSRHTKQHLFDLKQNGSVRCATFSPCGKYYMSAGGDGEVYIWDIRTRRCFKRFQDEGSLGTTAMAYAESMLSCGSKSGVVNLYDNVLDSAPRTGPVKPAKTFMHLTTRATGVTFNHDAQLMAMYSGVKKDRLKIVHTGTRTVMGKWPTPNTPLSYVSDVKFSPNSGLLAIGNDKGRVLLYRLSHFDAV